MGLISGSLFRCNTMSRRPNIVFILVDDLGWKDLGCYGSTFYETPNIDRLAAQGMRFTDAYAACPVCSEPVISTDFYPTILQMTQSGLKPDQHQDGESLVPLLRGEGSLHRDCLFWHYPHYSNQGGHPGSAIRCGHYKLIKDYETARLELYDLKADIGEQHNIIDEKPELAIGLHEKLQQWLESVNAGLPSPVE
jgi:arylsulfatase A-like enzyme